MSFDLQNYKSSFSKGEIFTRNANSALATMKSGKLVNGTSKAEINASVNKNTISIIDETTHFLRNNIMELVCIIDMSSSCKGLERATCAGYNNLIEKEKNKGYKTMVTTVLFSTEAEIITFRENIENVKPLAYCAHGCTALYDTIYDTITKIKECQNIDRNKPSKTVVAIMTDGVNDLANAHKKTIHDLYEVRTLIEERQRNGWEFIFLGALSNAQSVAASLGIDLRNSVEVEKSQIGMFNNFKSIESALNDLRTYGKLTDKWANASKKNNNSIESNDVKRLGLR